MRYIDSWLTGLGLEYIIPKLKANGITTPKKLAQLTLRDMYEVGKIDCCDYFDCCVLLWESNVIDLFSLCAVTSWCGRH